MQKNSKLELSCTGERLTTKIKGSTAIHHLHRYAFAMELIKEKSVLDIASGEGYGSNLLAQYAKSVIGVDISKEAITHSKRKYQANNLTFIEGSTDNIPLKENSIDVAISFETIEHHDKHQEMVTELKRVLKQDGVLIISSPDKLNYSDRPNYNNPFHVKELYKEDFETLMKSNFEFIKMYNQNISYNSLIIAEKNSPTEFKEFAGNYNTITTNTTLSNPLYNICIASDLDLKEINVNSSIFNASKALEDILNKENLIKESLTYKIGYYLTLPFRWLRKV